MFQTKMLSATQTSYLSFCTILCRPANLCYAMNLKNFAGAGSRTRYLVLAASFVDVALLTFTISTTLSVENLKVENVKCQNCFGFVDTMTLLEE